MDACINNALLEMTNFSGCHSDPAERERAPAYAGVSARRRTPKVCPLQCRTREFSSRCLGRTSCGRIHAASILGILRLRAHRSREGQTIALRSG
jgi:hypothetical protein